MSARSKVLLVLVLIVVFAAIGRTSLGDRLDAANLIATLRSTGSSALAIPLYFLLFGIGTSLFLPAVAMMVTAGVTWGVWPGWLVVWGAANVWVHVHFAVGRWITNNKIKAFLARRGAGRLVQELEQGGVLTTIMIRQVPFPFLLVNLAGGASPMRFRDWALGNALGLIPNCIIYTQLAAALADGVEGAKEAAMYRVLAAGAGIVLLAVISRWLQRRFAAPV